MMRTLVQVKGGNFVNDPQHWRTNIDQLRMWARLPRFGLLSDFDGTLSPIVAQPEQATIHPTAAAALDRLAASGAIVALISGRGAADLRVRFPRRRLLYYGNHGLERWDGEGVELNPLVLPWIEPLRAVGTQVQYHDLPGVRIEDKGASISIHYRNTPDPAHTRAVLEARLHPLTATAGLTLSPGRMVWEIKPPVTLSKGTATAAICTDYALDAALWLGDDVTDITAMERLRELRANGLHAGSIAVHGTDSAPAVTAAADWLADSIADTADLLTELAAARAEAYPGDWPSPMK